MGLPGGQEARTAHHVVCDGQRRVGRRIRGVFLGRLLGVLKGSFQFLRSGVLVEIGGGSADRADRPRGSGVWRLVRTVSSLVASFRRVPREMSRAMSSCTAKRSRILVLYRSPQSRVPRATSTSSAPMTRVSPRWETRPSQHRPDPEIAPHLSWVDFAAPEAKARAARDDPKIRESRELVDEGIGNAVAQVFVVGVAAHILEGQHCHRVDHVDPGRCRGTDETPVKAPGHQHHRGERHQQPTLVALQADGESRDRPSFGPWVREAGRGRFEREGEIVGRVGSGPPLASPDNGARGPRARRDPPARPGHLGRIFLQDRVERLDGRSRA